MALLTARSSTIFIARGETMTVYRSVDELPPELRRKLQQTTRGLNSATILIADKRGREELIRALQAQQPKPQRMVAEAVASQRAQAEERAPKPRLLSLRTWLELLLPVVIGASLWVLIESRF